MKVQKYFSPQVLNVIHGIILITLLFGFVVPIHAMENEDMNTKPQIKPLFDTAGRKRLYYHPAPNTHFVIINGAILEYTGTTAARKYVEDYPKYRNTQTRENPEYKSKMTERS